MIDSFWHDSHFARYAENRTFVYNIFVDFLFPKATENATQSFFKKLLQTTGKNKDPICICRIGPIFTRIRFF